MCDTENSNGGQEVKSNEGRNRGKYRKSGGKKQMGPSRTYVPPKTPTVVQLQRLQKSQEANFCFTV